MGVGKTLVMKVAKKVGKRLIGKLVRMGACVLAAPLAGGLAAIPVVLEIGMDIFDGFAVLGDIKDAVDLVAVMGDAAEVGIDLIGSGGSPKAEVGKILLGVIQDGADIAEAANEFNEAHEDWQEMHHNFLEDGILDELEQEELLEQGQQVVESFEDLQGEVNDMAENLIVSSNEILESQPSNPGNGNGAAVLNSAITSVTSSGMSLSADPSSVESLVFAGLRQAQMISVISAGVSLVGHAGSWYGLHALNIKIQEFSKDMLASQIELQSTFERGLQSLGAKIHDEFKDINTKLDRINQKLNVMLTSKLLRLAANARDASTGNDFVASISRGDIVECEVNLLHIAEEALLDNDWQGGIIYLRYAIKAYELEFAWLVAKGTDKFINMLPERLEEGGKDLGILVGRYLAATGNALLENWQEDAAITNIKQLFDGALNLSKEYTKLFAPMGTSSVAVSVLNTEGDKHQLGQEILNCPNCAELFWAIGDISMFQDHPEHARRDYHLALAFDPFNDAAWLRLIRSQGISHVRNVSLAFDALENHAVHMKMSTYEAAPTSTSQQTKDEICLQAILLFAELCDAVVNSTTSLYDLRPLLRLGAHLVRESKTLLQDNASTAYLLFGNLQALVPKACSTFSPALNEEMVAIFEATAEVGPFFSGNLIISFLKAMSENCGVLKFGQLPDVSFDSFASSLRHLLQKHNESRVVWEAVHKLYATVTIVGRSSQRMISENRKKALQPLTITACSLLNQLKPEAQIIAANNLKSDLMRSCRADVNITTHYALQCCNLTQTIDSNFWYKYQDGLVYSLADGRTRKAKFFMDQNGRKLHIGKSCPSKVDPTGWEPCGEGEMEWIGGSVYQGQWENNAMQGQGVLRIGKIHPSIPSAQYMEEGVVYNGTFVNGVFEGLGNLTFPNGTMFVGMFAKGLCTYGNYKFANGTTCLSTCDNVNGQSSGIMSNFIECNSMLPSLGSQLLQYGSAATARIVNPFASVFSASQRNSNNPQSNDGNNESDRDVKSWSRIVGSSSYMVLPSSSELKQMLCLTESPLCTENRLPSSQSSPSSSWSFSYSEYFSLSSYWSSSASSPSPLDGKQTSDGSASPPRSKNNQAQGSESLTKNTKHENGEKPKSSLFSYGDYFSSSYYWSKDDGNPSVDKKQGRKDVHALDHYPAAKTDKLEGYLPKDTENGEEDKKLKDESPFMIFKWIH